MDNYYYKLLLLFLVGCVVMMIYDYDTTTTFTVPIFYILWPLSIILVAINHHYKNTYYSTHKSFTKYIFIFLMMVSILILIFTNDKYYSHAVYRDSVYIIWTIIIFYFLLIPADREFLDGLSIIKFILFVGLILFFIYWYYSKK